MRILLFLGCSINQTWVRRRILRLELLHRFKVRGVGHDLGELLDLLELIQLCFLILCHSSTHTFPPDATVRPNDESTTINLRCSGGLMSAEDLDMPELSALI